MKVVVSSAAPWKVMGYGVKGERGEREVKKELTCADKPPKYIHDV